MRHDLKHYSLLLIGLLLVLAARPLYAVPAQAMVYAGPSSSFEAYKKSQKLHDLQLMAKWGTRNERQRSREALHKIQAQALKQQQRQQKLAIKQDSPAALTAFSAAEKSSKSAAHHAAKADTLMVVNINKATAAQLSAALLGVGDVKAQAIVDYRKANGGFKTLDDVLAVKGVGPATIAKNRDRIRFE